MVGLLKSKSAAVTLSYLRFVNVRISPGMIGTSDQIAGDCQRLIINASYLSQFIR